MLWFFFQRLPNRLGLEYTVLPNCRTINSITRLFFILVSIKNIKKELWIFTFPSRMGLPLFAGWSSVKVVVVVNVSGAFFFAANDPSLLDELLWGALLLYGCGRANVVFKYFLRSPLTVDSGIWMLFEASKWRIVSKENYKQLDSNIFCEVISNVIC